MIIHNVDQRSKDWFKLRKGLITASNAHRLLTPAKRKTYQVELLSEILTGELTEHFVSEAMQWGIEWEEEGLNRYQGLNEFISLKKVGFCTNENIPYIGCSPDAIAVATKIPAKADWKPVEYLIEVKCPTSKNYLEAMINGPAYEYIAQVQFQMLVTGFEYGVLVYFDPRFPRDMNMHYVEIKKDHSMIDHLMDGINDINSFIDGFLMEKGINR